MVRIHSPRPIFTALPGFPLKQSIRVRKPVESGLGFFGPESRFHGWALVSGPARALHSDERSRDRDHAQRT